MSSNPDSQAPQTPFGAPNRYTTTHDPATHKSVFSRALPEPLTGYGAAGMAVFDSYKTFTHPFNMTGESDIAALQAHPSSQSPSLSPAAAGPPNGKIWFPAAGETLLRYCDWAPGRTIPFHRTETLDLGVCVAGRMELTLDSGEVRVLGVGDTIVQRGTMHAWRNPSETEWARVVFFLLGAEPVQVGGEVMGEVLDWSGAGEGKAKAKEE
ncbi:oxalate oxidase GF-3.8 [Parachaetomium inaequale]|uniref:Oxalate oxidase GF-3.8 n=1 Tax=Parachaetomium inaequale TaxID=2588326 RepID=A0AAN6PJZ6_9PEZI|nr:oxalate oxidase GF-3.8 [Parachaetomium inaequale]